jgi:hypothetical protein
MNISEKKRTKERQNRTEWNDLSAERSNIAVYFVKKKEEQERSELNGRHQRLSNADDAGLLHRRINDTNTKDWLVVIKVSFQVNERNEVGYRLQSSH